MTIHSSILAWEIPWTEESGRLHTVHRLTEKDATEQLTCFTFPMDWAMEKASFILQVFVDLSPIAPALGDPQSGRGRQTHKQIIIIKGKYIMVRKKGGSN